MAENLVSKFTINSQGTDIDVKIKDEDARNLIAQEISDRSKLIKTDENNNTVIETSNKLIESSQDREINVNGSDSVHINGMSALNVGGQRTEVYAGDKTESVTGTETVTKNIVNETVNNLTLVGNNELKFKSDSLVLDSNGEPIKLGMNVTDDLYYGTLKVREATGNVREIMVKNNGTPNLARKFNNYILVGDSYAGGYTPEGNVTGWPVLLHGLLKGNLYGTITQGGAGLSANLTGDFNLTTKIDSLANSDEVDSIICCCGRNDIGNNIQIAISEGIKNFVNKCHEKFKNAKIYIGFIGWDLNVTEWEQHKAFNLATAMAAYKNVDADYTYINTDFILRRRSFMASDGKHPNQNGENALAYGIQCALYGGFPGFSKALSQHTFKNANNDTQSFMINESFTGGTTFLQFVVDVNQAYYATRDSVKLENYSLTIIKDAKLDFLVPSEFTSMQATIVLIINDSEYYRISAPLHFKPNSDGTCDIVMDISLINRTGNNWVEGVISGFWIKDSLQVANDLI